jgi:hypothetical protein
LIHGFFFIAIADSDEYYPRTAASPQDLTLSQGLRLDLASSDALFRMLLGCPQLTELMEGMENVDVV